ncbi:MAG: DUF86 domain-containing protein [Alphaproteobacteria bacterium]|nr:MAG: DUF86 domain-containing protein [Alphaproteobacteria bacterium]
MKLDSEYYDVIVEFSADIKSYVAPHATVREALKQNVVYDAVLRKLQLIAETTQRFSQGFKQQHSHIAWREMSGFRNILVHDYLGTIDDHVIIEVIEHHIPILVQQLTTAMETPHDPT